jgi:diacylglycerol kinase (ATP)
MNWREFPIIRGVLHWFGSASFAIEGILHATKSQRHIKFHMLSAFIVLFACFVIGVTKFEFIAISLVTLLVIAAEMFNSAIEAVVDAKTSERHEWARIAKDVSAGAVLVCAVGAAIVGYLVLWPYVIRLLKEGPWISKHDPENIAVLALIMVMVTVILMKAYLGKGKALRGGFPSGHAALSFSVFVSVTQITDIVTVIILFFVAAMAVTASRIFMKVHTFLEVLSGVVIGSVITYLLFFIFLK